MQTEGRRQRSEGQPGPQREPGLHLPVAAAVRRAAAGLPALRADQGVAAHPAEGPGGEAAAGRGAAGGSVQQPEPVTCGMGLPIMPPAALLTAHETSDEDFSPRTLTPDPPDLRPLSACTNLQRVHMFPFDFEHKTEQVFFFFLGALMLPWNVSHSRKTLLATVLHFSNSATAPVICTRGNLNIISFKIVF